MGNRKMHTPEPAAGSTRYAIVYGRVSHQKQLSGYSLDAQARLAAEYVKARGLTVIDEISTDESAKEPGRKEFNRMIELIQGAKEPVAIVVEKVDRLFRNAEDFVLVERLMKSHGTEIHYYGEGTVLSQRNMPGDWLLHGVKMLLGRDEVQRRSRDVKSRMIQKAMRGEFPGKPPAGYVIDPLTRAIVLHYGHALVVRQFFEMYARGLHSLDDLVAFAQQNGIMRLKGSQGDISKSTIERILKNIFYVGSFTFDGLVYEGTHPKLIDDDLYDKVQEVLLERGGGKYERRRFAFGGLMVCGYCGRAVTAEQQKTYVYYHCASPTKTCPDRRFVPEREVAECLETIVRHLALDQRVAETVRACQTSVEMARTRFRKATQDLVQGDIERLERRLANWDLKLADGTVSDETYVMRRAIMLAELADARKKAASRERVEASAPGQAPPSIDHVLADLVRLFTKQPLDRQRRLLDHIVARIEVTADGMKVIYRKPFDRLGVAEIGRPAAAA